MYGISISVTDSATPAVQQLVSNLDPAKVNPIAGRAGANVVRDHLFALDAVRPNKLGGRRQHFYAAAARSVNYQVDPDGATVSVNHVGIRLRYFGGTVRPVNRKFLTIPAIPEAYGKRAGEFNNLQVLWGKTGPYALAERAHTEIKVVKDRRKGRTGEFRIKRGATIAAGRIFFHLVRSATQQPDPTVLPDLPTIMRVVTRRLADALQGAKS